MRCANESASPTSVRPILVRKRWARPVGDLWSRRPVPLGIAVATVIATIIVACSSGAIAQSRNEYLQGVFLTPSTFDPSPARLRIGGGHYDFPKNTLFAFPSKDIKQRAVLLRVLYPEMNGASPSNVKNFKENSQESRRLQILISDYSLNPMPQTSAQAINTIYKVRLDLFAKSSGVRKVLSPNSQYGLSQVRIVRGDQPQYDIFVDQNESDGSRNVVVDCSPIERVKNPQCSLFFHYRDVVVEVTFARGLLRDWGEIRKAVATWLEKIRIKPSAN